MSAIQKIRLVVLISGRGSNLQAILDQAVSGELPVEVAAVISNRPGVHGLERARQAGVPALELDHKNFADRPEFEAALFPGTWTGVARQLVKTRFGFHIVAVDHRVAGEQLPFADAHAAIAQRLRSGVQRRALEQYVRVLAGQAEVRGVDLAAVATPLVQ